MNRPLNSRPKTTTATRRLDFGADSISLRRLLRHLVAGAYRVDANGTAIEAHFPNGHVPKAWSASSPGRRPHIADLLFDDDADATVMRMNLEQLFEDFLPEELTLEQLPDTARCGDRTYHLEYVVERQRGVIEALVVFARTPSETNDAAEQAREDAEFRQVTETLMANPEATRGFFGETQWLMEQLEAAEDDDALKRHLHTLKGTFGCFGFESLAEKVHDVEDRLIAGDADTVASDVAAIERAWDVQRDVYGPMFAAGGDDEIIVSREEYEDLVMNLMMQTDYAELLGLAQRWALDPISAVFARLGMQVKRVSSLLNRHVEVVSEHNLVRLPGGGLQPLWSSLVHVAVNAVTHGIEPPDERLANGKSATGTFRMTAEMDDDVLRVSLADDGRGIDWAAIEAKAQNAGLAYASHDDLVRALFTTGISTASETSMVAGRGVGTSAVWAATEELGGTVAVTSTPGEGTTFVVEVPLARLATMGLVS